MHVVMLLVRQDGILAVAAIGDVSFNISFFGIPHVRIRSCFSGICRQGCVLCESWNHCCTMISRISSRIDESSYTLSIGRSLRNFLASFIRRI